MMPHYDNDGSPSLDDGGGVGSSDRVGGGVAATAAQVVGSTGTAAIGSAGGGGGIATAGAAGGGGGGRTMSSPPKPPSSSSGATIDGAGGGGGFGVGFGGGGGVGSKRQRDSFSSSGLPPPPPTTSFGRSGSMDLIGLNNSRTSLTSAKRTGSMDNALTSARRTGSMDMIGGGGGNSSSFGSAAAAALTSSRRTGSMDMIGGGAGGGGFGAGESTGVMTTSSSSSVRGGDLVVSDLIGDAAGALGTPSATKATSLGLGGSMDLAVPGEFIPTSFRSRSTGGASKTGGGSGGGGKSGGGGGSGGRYTEAVPLSLSSATLEGPAFGFGLGGGGGVASPSTFTSSSSSALSSPPSSSSYSSSRRFADGVSSGIREIVSHALDASVRYARSVYPRHSFTIRDVVISRTDSWDLVPSNGIRVEDVPSHLRRVGYNFLYERNCVLFLSPGGMPVPGLSEEGGNDDGVAEAAATTTSYDDWPERGNALGRIVLRYASAKPLTEAQMQGRTTTSLAYGGASSTSSSGPVVLIPWQSIVEYRSLPPTGSISAASAEEIAMTSFGGSVDDELKLGALASLVDPRHKFVLGVRSARGKKYRFDLIDATLSNGAAPRYREESEKKKSLCVTVTDVTPMGGMGMGGSLKDGGFLLHRGTSVGASSSSSSNASVTRLDLTLEGPLRTPHAEQHYDSLAEHFRPLNPKSPLPPVDDPDVVVGSTSGHVLLLRPSHAGKIYVDGRYVTTWGNDVSIGSRRPALFGYDLLNVPVAEGRIVDYEEMKRSCGRLLQECFVDARQIRKDVAGRTLSRLSRGVKNAEEEERDLGRDRRRRTAMGGGVYYDYGKGDFDENEASSSSCCHPRPSSSDPSVDFPCLESEIMSDPSYDPVGISAKALATRFAERHGPNAYPCLPCDVEYVRPRIGRHRVPVPVPRRVVDVLRRGGYFDLRRTETERLWFDPSAARHMDDSGTRILREAIRLLNESGCVDVTEDRIVTVGGEALPPNPLEGKFLCRYSNEMREYYVNDTVMTMALPSQYSLDGGGSRWRMEEEEDEADDRWRGDEDDDDENDGLTREQKERAYVLGLCLAREHEDGNVLIRYAMHHRRPRRRGGGK